MNISWSLHRTKIVNKLPFQIMQDGKQSDEDNNNSQQIMETLF